MVGHIGGIHGGLRLGERFAGGSSPNRNGTIASSILKMSLAPLQAYSKVSGAQLQHRLLV